MLSNVPVRAGGLIYLSGVAASHANGDVGAATRTALDQARLALAAAGSSLDQVMSVLILLNAATDFQAMNDAYRSFWTNDFPTRTTLVTALATPGALVEVSVIAADAGGDRALIHPRGWAVSPSPYSYAIQSGDTVFLSGLVSRTGRDNAAVTGDIATQTRVILENAGELLAAAGLSHESIVCSKVYLTDTASFGPMNEMYRTFFRSAPPARATVQTKLAGPQYGVEITFVASSSPRRVVNEGPSPNPNLPLSPAIVAGGRAYLSGALGFDDSNKGNAGAQTRETLSRLRRTLAAAGAVPSDVAEAIVYVTDLSVLPDVDREYGTFFGTHAPARSTIRSGLMAPDGLVEIVFTAVKP